MTPLDHPPSGYRNALEPLVIEEVEQQLQHLPSHLLKYIDPGQVVAYALNRLPALYATSEEGWCRQQLRAKAQMKEQIFKAVRQGLVAVQKDPLKVSTPLRSRGKMRSRSKEVSKDLFQPTVTQVQLEETLWVDGWDAD